jgi:hypothetical protein
VTPALGRSRAEPASSRSRDRPFDPARELDVRALKQVLASKYGIPQRRTFSGSVSRIDVALYHPAGGMLKAGSVRGAETPQRLRRLLRGPWQLTAGSGHKPEPLGI